MTILAFRRGRVSRTFAVAGLAAVFAVCLAAASFPAHGQQAVKPYRIGFVSPTSRGPTNDAFLLGLKEAGYLIGQNVTVEARFAQGRFERFPELIAEVLGLKVDVLVVGSTAGALAAKRMTSTVPIVFAGVFDPVGPGIVTSLGRPGGNVTGTTFGVGGVGVAGKWVELLKEAVPNLSHVAVLWSPGNPSGAEAIQELATRARLLNVRLDAHDAGTPEKLDAAFAAIGRGGARGVIVTGDPFYFTNRAKLVQFAAGKRLPAMYFAKDFVDAGGLMAYGGSLADSYRRAPAYVKRLHEGAKPGDLPVEQPTRFELVVNLRTARALGLTIAQRLLLRADQLVE